MITDKDLQEAIAECQGVRNPNANTALKLAALYVIHDHLFGGEQCKARETDKAMSAYSFAPANDSNAETVILNSGTDFANAATGKRTADVMPVMDELMDLLKGLNKPLYNAVMRKIEDL